jgi:amino acid adenylation domain-containing protein
LLLVVHHVVFDAWSSGIFVRELSQIYNSVKRGEPPLLPPLHIQYGDFAVWQSNRLRGATLENHLSYWKKQLDGLPTLKLPIAPFKPVPGNPSSGREEFELSQELSAELRKLSGRTGTTLFMTLLAAYKVALHRYTGETDIAIGTPTAGRSHPGVEGLIGYFLNMLVLRTDLSGNPTFQELLERIRKICVGAFTHQDLPFEKIVEKLRPTRDLTHNPLIQVTFALQNTPKCPLNLEGVTAQDLEISTGVARTFDLHLFMVEEISGLRGYVSYNASLFRADFIRRFISHLQNILMDLVANPDQRISDLSMLTEPEKHQLLVEWNDSNAEYRKDACIHQLFEEQVDRTPEAIAVVFEDRELTYGELNRRANQLAHYLKMLGVGPEALVVTWMERSIEMIVGLLGILKAGGAYLPIDPNYPKERLELMLADAQAPVLLTQDRLLEQEGSRINDSDRVDRPMQWICLDRDWELIARESEVNPESTTTADNLAYVIYTSGSTGQPKGVQITHQSLLNLVFWHHQAFSVTPFDRATQLAGPAFDAAVWELWPYLTVGASIHIPDEMTRLDAASFRDWLVAQAITISFVPTILAESLMTLEWPRETALRILLTGGDTLHVYPPQTLPFRVFNNYGPTECTVVTASGQVWPNAHPVHPPTIGRPIANTQIYILDVYGNPVPIGVVGEIYIGGDGVARRYLNRPELTAEKFVCHSFDGKPVGRLYKTGDLGRYLPNGSIEFVGRIDDQVKIRGFRIELGEIEAVLQQHAGVREAVVLAREETLGDPADKRLVAYVVAGKEQTCTSGQLRRFLEQKLPEYMVPSTFVLLDAMPLRPNGKVDRRALPAPAQSRPELEKTFSVPRTPVEELLVNIWAAVLKLDKVGIHDNFFELGGHSLLATQVMSRVRQVLQVDLPLRALFEARTVAELALRIEQNASETAELSRNLVEVESLSEEETEHQLAQEATETNGSRKIA